jgi:hypothetical protein
MHSIRLFAVPVCFQLVFDSKILFIFQMEESIPGTSKGPNKNIKPGTVSIFDFFFV